jgi:para-aminobenzoate synthetase component 1
VNLRDIEGRSALLLGIAKDNNASCALGPFIRLFDDTFSLDDVRQAKVDLEVTGPDQFRLRGSSDLSKISRPGTVAVPALMRLERHPGLVHLVSDVVGELSEGIGWIEILDATFPPGSVTGAPKSSALRLIADLEQASRGPYCGAFGWVDADAQTASLAVTIRTFWLEDDDVLFGTGAGITWGSDPEGEWWETELKAQRLMSLAAGIWQGDAS